MDLHVLGCHEHKLTISGKYLFVSVYVCDKNFVTRVAQELIHRISWNLLCYPNIYECHPFFLKNRLTGDAVVTFFSKISPKSHSRFPVDEIAQKRSYKIHINRNNNVAIYVYLGGASMPFFPKFLWLTYVGFYCMESYKILHAMHLL